MKFRKKPLEIEANQYQGVPSSIIGLCQSHTCFHTYNFPHVHTIHNGQIVALEDGDWIIAEPDGEHFYPVKPDIFKDTYEPA